MEVTNDNKFNYTIIEKKMKVITDGKFDYTIIEGAKGFKNGHEYHGLVYCRPVPGHTADSEVHNYLVKLRRRIKRSSKFYVPYNSFDFINNNNPICGYAYNSVNDIFDEARGMKIARMRCIKKINNRKEKEMKALLNDCNFITDSIKSELSRLERFNKENK